jgi:hypothetical protein
VCKNFNEIVSLACFAEAILWERKNRLKGYCDELSVGPESVKYRIFYR